jgi:hypothetical protein
MLALTTPRPTNQTCLHRGDPLIWVLLPVELFDLCRLEEHHGTATAAVLAPAAPPPVLADATAAAVLAPAALPPVLAEAAAAAVLAPAAPPPMLADAAAAAVLAPAAQPPVLADSAAAALLALAALPPVLADAATTAVFALAAHSPVLADARTTTIFAAVAHPPVLADATAAAVLALGTPPPVLALRVHHILCVSAWCPPAPQIETCMKIDRETRGLDRGQPVGVVSQINTTTRHETPPAPAPKPPQTDAPNQSA